MKEEKEGQDRTEGNFFFMQQSQLDKRYNDSDEDGDENSFQFDLLVESKLEAGVGLSLDLKVK